MGVLNPVFAACFSCRLPGGNQIGRMSLSKIPLVRKTGDVPILVLVSFFETSFDVWLPHSLLFVFFFNDC